MLAQFKIRKQFNKLSVTMWVDVERKEACLDISYDRRLVHTGEAVAFHEVSTPDLAERWFSRSAGEYGNLIESWENQCRRQYGIGEKLKPISIWSCTWHNSKTNDAGEFLGRTKSEAESFANRRKAEGADTIEVQPTKWTPETSPPAV